MEKSKPEDVKLLPEEKEEKSDKELTYEETILEGEDALEKEIEDGS